MARQIIITDVVKQASGDFEITSVFWLTAPANRMIAKGSTFKSLIVNASQAELDLLISGAIVEQQVRFGALPVGTSIPAVKAALIAAFNAAQAALTATAAAAQFIGLAWDGSAWA